MVHAQDLVISPSVLNSDLADLRREVDRVAAHANWIHLDVMDAHFVPNLSFGLPVIESLLRNGPLPADCHLMIEDPDRWAPEYARAGAASVTFHVEAARDPRTLSQELRAAGARAGVAVKPSTPLDHVGDLMDVIDMILVMTVEPGFGGQAFMVEMLPKVKRARAMVDGAGCPIWVQVDGGIDERTIVLAAEAGADAFVAGSAVYRADDPGAMIDRLRALADR